MENAFGIFNQSIPYNLYAITAIILALIVVWKNINFGPMAAAEIRTQQGQISWKNNEDSIEVSETLNHQSSNNEESSAMFMILPILTMTFAMPVFLFLTGGGDIMKGNGSTAIFWSICAALFVCWTMLLIKKKHNIAELMQFFMEGAGNLLPIAAILLLALALGDVARSLGTGPYVASIAGANVPDIFLAPLVFLVSGFIAFSVGSSWGTFAIMIPIAISIATNLDLSVPMLLGASLSGGVFGDHASPISDTTVVASMAAGTDHIEHVRTQLPYAMIAGIISIIGFILLSL
jgi:Na+/H+ antiporter NhaC